MKTLKIIYIILLISTGSFGQLKYNDILVIKNDTIKCKIIRQDTDSFTYRSEIDTINKIINQGDVSYFVYNEMHFKKDISGRFQFVNQSSDLKVTAGLYIKKASSKYTASRVVIVLSALIAIIPAFSVDNSIDPIVYGVSASGALTSLILNFSGDADLKKAGDILERGGY